VLLLIRDRQVQSLAGLRELLMPPPLSVAELYMLRRQLEYILTHLEAAGLITVEEESVAPTELIERVQNALEISLTDLSRIGHGAIPVTPIFGNPTLVENVSDVFVLMPFAERMKPIYDDQIRASIEMLGLTVSRADDLFAAEEIVSDVWTAIHNCKVIVADLTGRNPNVFYEIGIAHTVGRPTILMSQSIDDIPFDLRHRRCIVYEYTPRGMQAFTRALVESIRIEARRAGLQVSI